MTQASLIKRIPLALALYAVALAVYACGTDRITSPSISSSVPHNTISDGASGGNSHFYFLPPMVARPTYSGVSDGTLSPAVTVCEWRTETGQCGNVIAEFDADGGTGAQSVRYDAIAQQYIVNWDTKTCLSGACTLDPAKMYRLQVFVGRAILGFADIKAAASGSEIKNASTGDNVSLVNGRTLPVKFRIERGAVKVVEPATPAPIDATGGTVAASDGTAALDIPAGAVNAAIGITIEEATNAPEGTVDGLAPVVELGPDGTQFNEPVTLTLPFDGSKLPPGVPSSALAVFTSDGTGWKEVAGSTVDAPGGTVSASIEHFSTYTIMVRPNTVAGAPAPTTIATGDSTTVQGYVMSYTTTVQQVCTWVSYGGWFRTYYSYQCNYYPTTYTYPATNIAVTWSSSQPAVASVTPGPTYTDAQGIAVSPPIAGVSPGVTAITGTTSGVSGNYQITVIESTVVRTTADDGPGSLRRVLTSATPGATITFARTLTTASGTCSTEAVPGCVIRLSSPLTISKNVTIQGPASAALLAVDGGHTTGTSGVQVLNIGSGTVVLRNLTISHGYAPSQGGGVFVQSGTVTLESCRIVGNHASSLNGGLGQGGGLYNLGGNVTLVSTLVSGDSAAAGGGLYNYNNGTLNVFTGSEVTDSYATNIGGGILNFGTLRLTSSNVRNNAAVNFGGGLYNFAIAQLVLTNADVSANRALRGGGIYNYLNGIVTLTGTAVRANIASINGGGIYNDGSLTVNTASVIGENKAPDQGGGIFNGAGTISLSSTTLSGNRATGQNGALAQGGGIYNANGTVTLSGVTLLKDTADAGGALYNYNFGTYHINGTTIRESIATNIGGGVLNFGKVYFTASEVLENRATNNGGGIYNFAVAQMSLGTTSVRQNTAQFGGGVYNYSNGNISLTGSQISLNNATVNGGGIFNDGIITLDAVSALLQNRAANQGGGIFNGIGSATLNGSSITGNRATAANGALGQGGGVYNHSGTVTLNGVTASRDTAEAGGALYEYNFGTINVNAGSTISESHAFNIGGGVLNFGKVNISGTTIRANRAVNQGGGIYNFAVAQLTVAQSSVEQNVAQFGGGIYNYQNGIVGITGSVLTGNSATINGGGIHNDGPLTMDASSALNQNRAANQGGGLYNGVGTVTITGATLNGNRATAANGALGQGGGVYNHSGTVNLAGISAARDTADAGGALYNYNFGTINVTAGSSIVDSYASNVGGGLLNFGLVRVTSSSFRRNVSVNAGGGLHNFAVAQLILTDADISENSASSGGGLFNYSNGNVTLAGRTSICNNSAATPPANIWNIGNLSGTNYDVVGGAAVCSVQ